MSEVTAQSLNETLTRSGALRNIRAQLRDAVFKAIGGGDKPPPLKNPLGKDAQIALALIEDFLRVFAFEWTASTAAAEIAGWGERLPATDVPGALQLPKANAAGLPLLPRPRAPAAAERQRVAVARVAARRPRRPRRRPMRRRRRAR